MGGGNVSQDQTSIICIDLEVLLCFCRMRRTWAESI